MRTQSYPKTPDIFTLSLSREYENRGTPMKEVYSYQEIGTLIDQGESATFTRHVIAHVTVRQPDPNSQTVKTIIHLTLGQYSVGLFEMEYEDVSELLEIFDTSSYSISKSPTLY